MTCTVALLLALVALPAGSAFAESPADRAVSAAERRVEREGAPAYVDLASAFMRKARETADAAYYERARAAVDRALALDPESYEALRVQAWVLVGQHDFRGGLAVAQAARRRRPADWWNYGTLTDAYVELGDYPRAVAAVDRMAALHPGLPAYTRIAYLRSLHGDRAGALAALRLAVGAASPQDPEGRAWTLVHLGHEHFAGGELLPAARAYTEALEALPDYPLALAGLGRVRAAEGRLAEATTLYERAVERLPSPDLIAALGDVHAAAGADALAEQRYALVEHEGRVAAATGTTYGRQLALFFADHDRRLDEALRLAREEAGRRGDIYTDDALAWALYKNGRAAAAKRVAERALRLGTPDASLEYHAGMIGAALGRPAPAARHLARALGINPHFDLRQAPLARAALDEARAAVAGQALAVARRGS